MLTGKHYIWENGSKRMDVSFATEGVAQEFCIGTPAAAGRRRRREGLRPMPRHHAIRANFLWSGMKSTPVT